MPGLRRVLDDILMQWRTTILWKLAWREMIGIVARYPEAYESIAGLS